MQSEKVEFTFKLGLINLYNPVAVQFLLNDTTVHNLSLSGNSNSVSFIAQLEDNQDYCLKLQILALSKPTRIVINNININWPVDADSSRYLRPGWRAESPNEVWNYTDPDAQKNQELLIKRTQNVDLDYFIGRKPGYIKKFGRFEPTGGETTYFSNLNKPFAVTAPGTFKLNFTAPISYWLYRNLF
jgi:hypothetical protein